MSSYLSLTQLETLPVQRVTDVVTEFVQNVPLLPAHRPEVVRATHQLRYQQHSVPCRVTHPRYTASVDPHRERVTDRHAAKRCLRFCSQLHGFKSGLFGGHRSWEMNAGVVCSRNLTVSRALCAGALSC